MHGESSSISNPSLVQGICPNGWHVPSNAEWNQLTNYVRSQSQYLCSNNMNNIAMALAAPIGWYYSSNSCDVGSGNGINATGLSIVPAGTFLFEYSGFGSNAVLWSATENGNGAECRSITTYGSTILSYTLDKYEGSSVRCVRNDTTPKVTTSAATNVLSTVATLNGSISNPYNVTIQEQGFEWKPVTVSDYSVVNVTGTTMTYHLIGLNTNTTYVYRAFASTAEGMLYGDEILFTTMVTAAVDSIQIGGGQPCPGVPSVTDIDGNVYNTVQIGNQCWIKSNLRTTRYADGTAISIGATTSTTTPYRYIPNSDTSKVAVYGYLYNWVAVMHGANSSSANPSLVRGVCPMGWHVPSDAEWTQLKEYMSGENDFLCSGTADKIAKALASPTGWESSNINCSVGNNQSINNAAGFSALPAGLYNSNNYFYFSNQACFWSTTVGSTEGAYGRNLRSDSTGINRIHYYRRVGLSVRCIRDMGETSYTVPTVITNTVFNVTTNTASCGGVVTADGDSTVTERGVCWSIYQNPTVSNNHTTNGSGMGAFTSNIIGLSDGVTYYVRAYATNAAGTAYGNEVSFTTEGYSSHPCPNIATVTDYDGNIYNTVKIGNQCWLKENLRTTSYADGTVISMGTSTSTTVPYRYAPNNDTSNVPVYGYLYNWEAVMKNSSSSNANPNGVQGVCPLGWHVPSNAEWTELTNFIRGQSEFVCGSNNTNIAKTLASTTGWNSSVNDCAVGNNLLSNNITGFSALPAGYYANNYYGYGNSAYYWSATNYSSSDAYQRSLYYDNANVTTPYYGKYEGASVRCLRDSHCRATAGCRGYHCTPPPRAGRTCWSH